MTNPEVESEHLTAIKHKDALFKSKSTTGACFPPSGEEDLGKYFAKYDMTHKKPGVAYIFNNENFQDPLLNTRYGSSKDVHDFERALIKLGFHEDDINVYTDSTAEEMFDVFQMFNEENLDIDCFICVILSHGSSDDIIYGYDGVIELDRLLSCLRPDRCPSLTGIPKLIFIEASRGNKLDYGVLKSDAAVIEPDKNSSRIPIMADMLIVYSSFAGYQSFRDRQNGSWFMRGLSKILIEFGTKYEIMKLLTAVSNYVASLEAPSWYNSEFIGCKQMPCIGSSLTKQLKFVRKNKSD
ncbi:caspase-7 [Octopus bimaculoides]|uniref:Caspase family p20 domain-containing protein n=1 Tax=Octopus bimaculoides TaxID=37653 RepID=A0A0L8H3U8_OCTBM|nr:caspase-7 [Octopus bimaculoides]|eukprot:XP_014775614.1 PREDICTED: caspase-6-like [Octopus bimaculoides]